MFFKNLRLYQLGTEFNPDGFEEKLTARPARPCMSLEAATMGWLPPVDGTLLLARQMQGATIICLKIEEKILPKAAVNKVLLEKIRKIKSESDRIVRRKERDTLRDEIMQDLLPRALTKEEKIYAYIDHVHHLIVVDTASPKKAEALLTLLRISVGSLPAIPLMGTVNHGMVLTDWMRGEAPPNFTVDQDTVLRGEDDKVSLSGVDLSSQEAQAHIDAGMVVERLAVTYNDRMSFTLCDDLGIKKLTFSDVVQEEAIDMEAEDAAARLDVDFTIMLGEIRALVGDLRAVFQVKEIRE